MSWQVFCLRTEVRCHEIYCTHYRYIVTHDRTEGLDTDANQADTFAIDAANIRNYRPERQLYVSDVCSHLERSL